MVTVVVLLSVIGNVLVTSGTTILVVSVVEALLVTVVVAVCATNGTVEPPAGLVVAAVPGLVDMSTTLLTMAA